MVNKNYTLNKSLNPNYRLVANEFKSNNHLSTSVASHVVIITGRFINTVNSVSSILELKTVKCGA